jgi:hypothetical protein
MKKVKDFFVKNMKNIIALISGVIVGACFIVLVLTIQQRVSQQLSQKNSKIACHQAYRMMCVQVHACTSSSVAACDNFVEQTKPCEVEELPSEQVIERCTEQLRHVECSDDLPPTCGTFME